MCSPRVQTVSAKHCGYTEHYWMGSKNTICCVIMKTDYCEEMTSPLTTVIDAVLIPTTFSNMMSDKQPWWSIDIRGESNVCDWRRRPVGSGNRQSVRRVFLGAGPPRGLVRGCCRLQLLYVLAERHHEVVKVHLRGHELLPSLHLGHQLAGGGRLPPNLRHVRRCDCLKWFWWSLSCSWKGMWALSGRRDCVRVPYSEWGWALPFSAQRRYPLRWFSCS